MGEGVVWRLEWFCELNIGCFCSEVIISTRVLETIPVCFREHIVDPRPPITINKP